MLILLLFLPAWSAVADASVYSRGTPSRDGIGKIYMGREISRVMGHPGARWLERPSREREELPERVADEMGLSADADADVADIGAGTGSFSFRLAARVPQGRVYAVDIQPEMLAVFERPG